MLLSNYFVGCLLAVLLFLIANKYKILDSCEFYFSVLVAVTTYYIAFAFEHEKYVFTEVAGALFFAMLGLFFLRKSMIALAFLIVAHGLYDYLHLILLPDSGTPKWWPGFCATFDIVFGGLLIIYIKQKNRGSDYESKRFS